MFCAPDREYLPGNSSAELYSPNWVITGYYRGNLNPHNQTTRSKPLDLTVSGYLDLLRIPVVWYSYQVRRLWIRIRDPI